MENELKIKDVRVIENQMLSMGFTPEKFIKEASFAIQIWNDPKNYYLRKAPIESFLQAIKNIAQTGLTLNPVSKEAYLIPRYESKSNQVLCKLEPSYVGLVKLLTDSGSVNAIQTHLVNENDEFDVNLGFEIEITHKPFYVRNKPKGKYTGVYTIAKLSTGEKQYEYMTIEDVYSIRETSESWKSFQSGKTKSSIWKDYEGEMIRKTCIKRISKYLPRTERMQNFDNAIQLSNQDFEVKDWQIASINDLLRTSTILDSQKEQIERELSSMTSHSAFELINYLKDNQPNPITEGSGYGQKDIHKQLDNIMSNDKK